MTETNSIIDLLRSFTVRHDTWRVEDALDALTVEPSGHVKGLTKALSDPDDELRLLAVEVLYSMGNKAEPALPTLIDSLNDEDRIVRVATVAAVVNFGHKAAAAVPTLMTWLDGDDDFSEVTLDDLSIPGDEIIESLVVDAIESIIG